MNADDVQPRPGDIVALYDARLKGRKGIQTYEQHIGSVEDALVGVIIDFDPKGKHKIKALQVERGVPGEMSYRCDDLKSGRIVVSPLQRLRLGLIPAGISGWALRWT